MRSKFSMTLILVYCNDAIEWAFKVSCGLAKESRLTNTEYRICNVIRDVKDGKF